MRTKINFDDRKMVIHYKSRIVTQYYEELMYIKYEKPIVFCILQIKINIGLRRPYKP